MHFFQMTGLADQQLMPGRISAHRPIYDRQRMSKVCKKTMAFCKCVSYRSWFVVMILVLAFTGAFSQTPPKAVLKTDSGQSIPDTLLFKLQKAQAAITEVNAANQKGYGAADVRTVLVTIRNNIAPIQADLRIPRKALDPKTLMNYNLILNNSQQQLQDWQAKLTKASNDLQHMSKEVVSLSNDSLLSVNNSDSASKRLYANQLLDIKFKLQAAGKANSASLDTVSRLLAAVSAVYLDVTGLQANISERLEASGRSILRKESPYIWQAPPVSRGGNMGDLMSSSYAGQQKILGYFISSGWDNRMLVLLFSGLFFLWVYLNFRKAERMSSRGKMQLPSFIYLTRVPVIATLIVLFNIAPAFEANAPSPYIELTQFLLIIVLTIPFRKQLKSKRFSYWLLIAALYVIIVLAGTAVHDALPTRLFLMVINTVSIYLGLKISRHLKSERIASRFIRPVVVIYLLLNALAVALNVFGRISLAKIYSTAAIIGLTQIIGLAVFIQILSNALELQIKVSACNGGLFSRISINKTRVSFRRVLSVIAVVLWVLVFLIDLSIAGGVFAFIHQLLVKPRVFGSISFTLGNVLFFGLILYVSNVLQKYIGILFGEKSVTFRDHVEHKSSKLTLLRLIIVTGGVLLAVMASGIPLDKLTVVLGALSVGIGLGMQNIVNNFVSGIILIFEKPFQIGDFIELVDRKGRIQDIGIRSSKMLTPQGGQVIIPNADLITNRFVNWTVNTANIQSELIFKVPLAADMNAVSKIIQEEIKALPATLKDPALQILINSVGGDAIELKVLVWITSVYAEPEFKSQLLGRLITRLASAQVKLV